MLWYAQSLGSVMRIEDSCKIILFLSIVVSVANRFRRFILFLNHKCNQLLDYISHSLSHSESEVVGWMKQFYSFKVCCANEIMHMKIRFFSLLLMSSDRHQVFVFERIRGYGLFLRSPL